jgi:hypothetical protein
MALFTDVSSLTTNHDFYQEASRSQAFVNDAWVLLSSVSKERNVRVIS